MLFLLAWASILLAVLARSETSLRTAVLRATTLWGCLAVLSAEGLGWFGALDAPFLTGFWLVVCLACVVLFFTAPWRLSLKTVLERCFYVTQRRPVLLGSLALLCAGTLLTALISPPNTYDSLTYHLPKVEHWVQNRSLAHYPTNILRQIALNPGAEILILHSRLWSGSDSIFNLIQWLGYAVAIIAASAAAARLGAGLSGQLLGALWLGTLPMAILQASSTQNDLLTGTFSLVFIERYLVLRERTSLPHAMEAGAALGLAVVTKGTAMIVLLPFCLLLAVELVRKPGPAALRCGLALTIPVIALNVGWWFRNYVTFGTPLSYFSSIVGNSRLGVDAILSNSIRELTSELMTAWPPVNETIVAVALSAHRWLGLDPNAKEMTAGGSFGLTMAEMTWPRVTHEDFAANPIHTLLLLVVLVALISRVRRLSAAPLIVFASVVFGAVLYCLLLRWSPWGTRYHLTWYMVWAPLVGMVVESWQQILRTIAVGLQVLASMAPLLANASRSLLPSNAMNGHPAIWQMSRDQGLFIQAPHLEHQYRIVAEMIADRRPRRIGLLMVDGSVEYPLWYLLRATGSSPRIVHVLTPIEVPSLPEPPPELIFAIDREIEPSALAAALGCRYESIERFEHVTLLERRCDNQPVR